MTIDERHPSQEPSNTVDNEAARPSLSRRSFMGAAGQLAVSATVAGVAVNARVEVAHAHPRRPDERRSPLDQDLVDKTLSLRRERAATNAAVPLPRHLNNGDEARYANKIGSDTRGLPHDAFGEVDPKAWASLSRALETQDPADFENVILGGTRKLVQPLATLAVNLSGLATPQHAIPPAPALASVAPGRAVQRVSERHLASAGAGGHRRN
jgi:hypothetical protein